MRRKKNNFLKMIFTITLVIGLGILFSSCSKNAVSENNKKEITSQDQTKEEKPDVKESDKKGVEKKTGLKEKYLNVLSNLEIQEKDLKIDEAKNTMEMIKAFSSKYDLYDKELNEIYKELKAQLSKEDMDRVEKEEIQWITNKETKAKEDSVKYKGGTMEKVEYTASLAESTKTRCYELVNLYMPN